MITYLPPVGLEERILETMDRMAGFAFLHESLAAETESPAIDLYHVGRAHGDRANVRDLRATLRNWRAEDNAHSRVRRLIEEVS